MSYTTTENADKAFSTTGNFCLDFFTRITRSALFNDYIDAFNKAWVEDKEIATQLLMNMRDVRNGKGEKFIPAVIMVYLKNTIPIDVYEVILRKMIEYGYWKDLLRIIEIDSRTILETSKHTLLSHESIEIKLFAEQLKKDNDTLKDISDSTNNSDTKLAISLCSKWAPSETTHYNHYPMYAALNIMQAMNLTPKEYRIMLSKLRKHLNILEMYMSTNQFDKIDFSKLPSVAMMKMKKAFSRDTNADGLESENRKSLHLSYQEYLKKLSEGKTKVNIKGIQPHELVSTYFATHEIDHLVEEQWIAIKKHILESGAFRNVTAVIDVSASMSGQPMQVAIALGILVAECTKGPFNGRIITFDDNPSWHTLIGSTLLEKVKCMRSAPWGGSTNLKATFDMILQSAIDAELTQDEMVKTLFIFTDMQFNQCCSNKWESTFENAKRNFNNVGYQLPRIVCWNLRTSTSKSLPITQNEEGFTMLSGFSAELLKCILNAEEFTPWSMMMHVLEPYQVPIEVKLCSVSKLTTTENYLLNLQIGSTKSVIKKAFKSNKTDAKLIPSNSNLDSKSNSD